MKNNYSYTEQANLNTMAGGGMLNLISSCCAC